MDTTKATIQVSLQEYRSLLAIAQSARILASSQEREPYCEAEWALLDSEIVRWINPEQGGNLITEEWLKENGFRLVGERGNESTNPGIELRRLAICGK